jgi:hypothetical protein
MPKRPKYDPADDLPKVGDIWARNEPKTDGTFGWQYYLLTELHVGVFDSESFTAVCLNDGYTMPLYFNFELDDWRFVG